MPNTVAKTVPLVYVVAAIIQGTDGRILLAKRPDAKHQGGKWEFPGGKVESGEQPTFALARELEEELGIQADPHSMALFAKITHHYPEKSIYLEFWRVTRYEGQPQGLEGQPIAWFKLEDLAKLNFPEANRPVVNKLLDLKP